jgi:hypothetical protein
LVSERIVQRFNATSKVYDCPTPAATIFERVVLVVAITPCDHGNPESGARSVALKVKPQSSVCLTEGVALLNSIEKREWPQGATFAKGNAVAWRLTKWAAVGLAGGCLFKSDADLAVFRAVKGQVVAVLQVVLGDFQRQS